MRSLIKDNIKNPYDDIAIGETPLIVAAQCNNIEVISLLLKAPNIQVNKMDAYGMTALMYAAQRGHEQAVILLLKGNASRRMFDRSGKTAIDYATMEGKSLIAAIIEADPYS